MIQVRKPMFWERPFMAEQNAMNAFVQKTVGLPGLLQIAIYPFVVLVSVLHIPIVLTYFLLSVIVDRIVPVQVPKLSRAELGSMSRELHDKWTTRYSHLRQSNPLELADAIALPVIDALRAAIDGLSDDNCDCARLQQIATALIDLPAINSPDGHTLGLCIREFAETQTKLSEDKLTSEQRDEAEPD
jgi:hypothetical protein